MSRVSELVVTSGVDITKHSLHSCMMNRKGMGGELREEGDSMCKIGASTSNQIHKRSNHLLVQALIMNRFGRVCFRQLTFGVNGGRDRAGFRETEAFEYLADELFLGQSDCSLCLLDFDSENPLQVVLDRELEVSIEELKQVVNVFPGASSSNVVNVNHKDELCGK